jgi:hypothetical protein
MIIRIVPNSGSFAADMDLKPPERRGRVQAGQFPSAFTRQAANFPVFSTSASPESCRNVTLGFFEGRIPFR